MKKVFKIILIIFILLSITAGGLAIWQWKNIQGIIIGVSEDAEEIEKRRDGNQKALVDEIKNYMEEPLREMTEEEKQQVEEGSTSVNEVYKKIFEEKQTELEEKKKEGDTGSSKDEKLSPASSDSSKENGKQGKADSAGTSAKENKPSKDEIISRYMSQLYGLQNEFTARAEATIAQGDRYYESIKKHDSDAGARAATISRFTPVVRGIESECDARVEAVIANLKSELEAIDADTSIINSIRSTYANEKQLKLSYYSNKYLK